MYPQSLFDETYTTIYSTVGYSGPSAVITDTEVFSTTINLQEKQGFRLDCKYKGNNTTDDLIITLYEKIAAAWTGNEIGRPFVFDPSTTDVIEPLVIREATNGGGDFRLGMKSSAGATTYDVAFIGKYWRYEISET